MPDRNKNPHAKEYIKYYKHAPTKSENAPAKVCHASAKGGQAAATPTHTNAKGGQAAKPRHASAKNENAPAKACHTNAKGGQAAATPTHAPAEDKHDTPVHTPSKSENAPAKVCNANARDEQAAATPTHANTKDGQAAKPRHAPHKNSDAAIRVFYCFILSSFLFALVVIPTRVIFDEVYRASTEYRLILFQLTAGLVFLRLPRLLSRPLGIEIPHGLYIAYMLFLWAAIFLGEFALLYYRVPFWDTLMHFFSAVLLTLLGLSLPTLITGEKISPPLSALLAVGFSVLVGVLWEIYEFSFDGLLGLNMQKFSAPSPYGLSPLLGRAALYDTMTDLIVDLAGSLIPSIAACIYIRKKGDLPHALTVRRR